MAAPFAADQSSRHTNSSMNTRPCSSDSPEVFISPQTLYSGSNNILTRSRPNCVTGAGANISPNQCTYSEGVSVAGEEVQQTEMTVRYRG
jgi:hypothetical protein